MTDKPDLLESMLNTYKAAVDSNTKPVHRVGCEPPKKTEEVAPNIVDVNDGKVTDEFLVTGPLGGCISVIVYAPSGKGALTHYTRKSRIEHEDRLVELLRSADDWTHAVILHPEGADIGSLKGILKSCAYGLSIKEQEYDRFLDGNTLLDVADGSWANDQLGINKFV